MAGVVGTGAHMHLLGVGYCSKCYLHQLVFALSGGSWAIL